ncbi:MAG: M67 family metallopeptidase [Spirochaetaceae bacterium]|jgi:proteasome lid subunit RPN8/RPN11|nr:M67 family metallopeptidase [Spirochaetaceae bacterium]
MLWLSPELEKNIMADGEAAYPNECCGIILGEINDDGVKNAKRTVAISNSREDSEQYHRFLITPEDMLRAEQTARAAKLEVIGFYHSHPDHPSAPSGYDKDHALPFYSYVIVSVDNGKAQVLTSWELTDDRIDFLQENMNKGGNN